MSIRNSSPARWLELPTPEEPKPMPRRGLELGDQALHVGDAERGVDPDAVRHVRQHGGGGQRLARIIALVEHDEVVEDVVGGGGDEQRVAVRPRPRDLAHADRAARAGPVLHHEALPEALAQVRRQQPRGRGRWSRPAPRGRRARRAAPARPPAPASPRGTTTAAAPTARRGGGRCGPWGGHSCALVLLFFGPSRCGTCPVKGGPVCSAAAGRRARRRRRRLTSGGWSAEEYS